MASKMEIEDQIRERLFELLNRRPGCRQLVGLLCAGFSRKQIAAKLGLSKHTVDWHLRRLYRDAGVSGAVALAFHLAPRASGRLAGSRTPP